MVMRIVIALFLFLFGLAIHPLSAEPPILRIGLPEEPSSSSWSHAISSTDRFLASFLMRGIYRYSENGKPVCDLCKKVEFFSQGRRVKVFLKDKIFWSDGKPMMADHFVRAFKYLLNPKNKIANRHLFHFLKGPHGVKALNRLTLEFHLQEPVSYFKDLLTLPATFPRRKDHPNSLYSPQLNVLGPYQLVEWKKGKRLVLEGNPKFTEKRPAYRVEFRFGTPKEQFKLFSKGRLDIYSQPDTKLLLKLKKPRIQLSPTWATRLLWLNTHKAPLSSNHFRKSMLLALKKKELPAILGNGERFSAGFFPPGVRGSMKTPLVLPNLTQAKALRHRVIKWPKKVSLKLLRRNRSIDAMVADWIARQLQEIHIHLKSVVVTESEFQKKIRLGEFETALTIWSFQIAHPIDLLSIFESSSKRNFTRWSSVPFDSLFSRFLKDERSDQSLIRPLTQLIEEEQVPAIALSHPVHSYLLGRRISKFQRTPFGDPDLVNIRLKAAK